MKVPFSSFCFIPVQPGKFLVLCVTTLVIDVLPLLPFFDGDDITWFQLEEGIFNSSPFTSMCLWLTNWRAAGRLEQYLNGKTVLSETGFHNLIRFSPVTPCGGQLLQMFCGVVFQDAIGVFCFCFSRSWRAYSPQCFTLALLTMPTGGLLFWINHFPLPRIGSPKPAGILVFGPLYRHSFIHLRFL